MTCTLAPPLVDSIIILKGECDLYCHADESGIRSELVKLFKTKLPFIANKDFDFARRDGNTISIPLVKEDHVWDFKHVKHLCGTGRLYLRLNVCKDTLTDAENGIEAQPPSSSAGSVTQPATSSSFVSLVDQAGTGSHAHSGLSAATSLAQPTTSDAGPCVLTRHYNKDHTLPLK